MKPVAIVGTNITTRPLIDWELDADYWVFNEVPAIGWAKRVDGCFQMHIPPLWKTKRNVNYQNYYEWLQQPHPFPIWMQRKYKEVPASVKFPLKDITNKLLPNFTDEKGNVYQNFTSSAAYAIALAIYQKRPEIYLFGIEMGSDTEFIRQKPGVYFWIGMAMANGIKVIKRSQSLLFKDRIYGYKGEVVIQKQEFELSMGKYAEEAAKSQNTLLQSKGAAQALLEAIFIAPNEENAKMLATRFIEAQNEALDYAFKYGQFVGAVDENRRYIKECDEMINAAGGERALKIMMGESDGEAS